MVSSQPGRPAAGDLLLSLVSEFYLAVLAISRPFLRVRAVWCLASSSFGEQFSFALEHAGLLDGSHDTLEDGRIIGVGLVSVIAPAFLSGFLSGFFFAPLQGSATLKKAADFCGSWRR